MFIKKTNWQGAGWQAWRQLMVVHLVTLVDCLVGLLSMGFLSSDLRERALFNWFVEDEE